MVNVDSDSIERCDVVVRRVNDRAVIGISCATRILVNGDFFGYRSASEHRPVVTTVLVVEYVDDNRRVTCLSDWLRADLGEHFNEVHPAHPCRDNEEVLTIPRRQSRTDRTRT